MNMVATIVANRRPQRAELQRRLEAAALSLWREQGFEAVSVDAIVARAGVSKGAFFTFFPTKADALRLYAAELNRALEAARALLDPVRPLSSLEAFAEAAEAVLVAEGALARALWRELGARAFSEITAPDRARLRTFVEAAQAAQTLDPDVDPQAAADLLCDVWAGAMLNWVGRGGGLAERMRPRLRLLVCGLGVKD